MRPAFDSTREAAAFLLLLLGLLAAPLLSKADFMARRKETFSSQSLRFERYPWLQDYVMGETNDIDIAFVGSSRIGYSIDTAYVQDQLSRQLGRPAVVRSVCWYEGGFGVLYNFTRELLAHRRVKMLVFYDDHASWGQLDVQGHAAAWYRYGDAAEVMSRLPWAEQAFYYFASVLGMPRNLLEAISPNLPLNPNRNPNNESFWFECQPETHLGSFCFSHSFDFQRNRPLANFVESVPNGKATPADIVAYSAATASNFVFLDSSSRAEGLFQRAFGDVVRQSGCKLVLLHVPLPEERHSPVMIESRYWPEALQTKVQMIGLPGSRLFEGLTDSEFDSLFIDALHFNVNGQKYFSHLITPELLDIYETTPNR